MIAWKAHNKVNSVTLARLYSGLTECTDLYTAVHQLKQWWIALVEPDQLVDHLGANGPCGLPTLRLAVVAGLAHHIHLPPVLQTQ